MSVPPLTLSSFNGLLFFFWCYSIFSGPTVPDPVDISLEYLSLCKEYPDTVSIKNMQAHIRRFLDFQW